MKPDTDNSFNLGTFFSIEVLPNQLLHRGQVDSVDHVRLNKQLCKGLPCIVIEIRVYTASVMKIVPSVYAFLSTLSITSTVHR